MKSCTILFTLFIAITSTSYATEETISPEKEAELTATQKEQTFISYCGSANELISIMGLPPGDTITEADLAELQTMREPIMSVITEGALALDKIVEEGNKNDTGGFGAILICGVIDSISEAIKTRGCKNLATNAIVYNGPGLQLCKDIIGSIMKD